MKKKILMLLAIIFCFGAVVIFFYNKEKRRVTPIENPAKIILYNKGTVTNISDNNDKYKRLVEIANHRIKLIKGATLSSFMKEDIKKNSMLLEFDYSNENKLNYWDAYTKKEASITYFKLYFCLDKNNPASKVMSFEGKGYSPLGILTSPDEMIEVLNK